MKKEYEDIIFAGLVMFLIMVSSVFILSGFQVREGLTFKQEDINEDIDVKEILFQDSLYYKVIQWQNQ